MYSLQQIRRGVQDPSLVLGEAAGVYLDRFTSHEGVDFFERDWDSMLILDACRYDLFRATNELDGRLDSVQSPASQTTEFLEKTVDGETLADTVYVSANPQVTRVDADFADVVPLWEDGWDDESRTVRPETVADDVLDRRDEYADKRLVVHFVQPHIPFIGPTGETFEQPSLQGGVLENRGERVQNVWMRLRRGELDEDEVWRAYRENLVVALPAVERLLDALEGKTVVTSDHGNAFGEWFTYGHPPERHIDPLTHVPWFVSENGPRRETTDADETVSTTDLSTAAVRDRLSHLGYVE